MIKGFFRQQMIKTYVYLFLCGIAFLPIKTQAQSNDVRPFYLNVHAGTPLFWGDFSSTAEKLRLGYGGGLSLGYRLNTWLATEVDVNYLKGKLGASSTQGNDLLDEQGLIRYTQGSYKAGDVYSKVSLFRVGISLPVSIFPLLGHQHKFNIALAPHAYLNKFTPGIYAIQTHQKLTSGAKPDSWSYSVGADVGLSYALKQGKVIFLRSALSWLSDDRFEGLRTEPAWRDNFMLYTSVGVRFNLGKKKNSIAQAPVEATIVVASTKKEAVVEVTHPYQAAERQPIQLEKTPEKPQDPNPNEWLSPIYFKLNQATLDKVTQAETLNLMLQRAQHYPHLPIVIEGWSDTSGPVAFNNSLAQQRAEALARYLIQQGVDPKRIQVIGKGSDKQLGASAKARRAELKFIINP